MDSMNKIVKKMPRSWLLILYDIAEHPANAEMRMKALLDGPRIIKRMSLKQRKTLPVVWGIYYEEPKP